VYVTPSHQFPTGVVMSLPRRLALLEWARANDAWVIEDDYDSEYRYEGRPIEAVQGLDRAGRVIYAGTLSKVLYPALRLGYLVLPPALVEPFRAAKWVTDRHSPTLGQEVLAAFIAEGHFERHLRRARTRNAARRAALLAALASHLGDRVEVVGANAGMHLLAWLRDVTPRALPSLIDAAAREGVGVYSIAPYFFRPPRRAGLILGYAPLTERQIREGIARLAGAITSAARARGSAGRRARR
jgi:GntR family transcriptional regulator/MocR family aminotransferase